MKKRAEMKSFNWYQDGLVYTCHFLKEHDIDWKTITHSIRFGIVASQNRLELDFWLHFLLKYQEFQNVKAS